jgi:hypothetical protein
MASVTRALAALRHPARQHVGGADEGGDEGIRRVVVQRHRRADLLHDALVEHGHAVGRAHRLFLVVRDEDRRQAEATLQGEQLPTHLHAQGLVEIRERLVQQQHLRLDDDRAGQGDALLLPARELVRPPFGVRREADQLEGGVDPRPPGRLVDLALDQAEGDVVAHREVRPERIALEHHAHVAQPRRLIADVDAVDQHLPLLLPVEAGDQAQQRRLARARRPSRAKNSPGSTAMLTSFSTSVLP